MDTWCRRCPEAATQEVNGEAYCARHGLLEDYKLNSTAWNPSTDRTTPTVSPWVQRAMAGRLPAKEVR